MRAFIVALLSAGLLACGLQTSGLAPTVADDAGAGAVGADSGMVVTQDAAPEAPSHGGAAPEGGASGGSSGADASEAPDAAIEAAAPCKGTTNSCGPAGACVDCTQDPKGAACLGGTCGCSGQQDCAKGEACSPQSHTCGTSCAGGLACNGGCCDGTSCQTGTADNACGSDGGACNDCTKTSGGGSFCQNGGTCGCPMGGLCGGSSGG